MSTQSVTSINRTERLLQSFTRWPAPKSHAGDQGRMTGSDMALTRFMSVRADATGRYI